MTYWRLHYHLIFSTFERQPILVGEREKMFYGVIYQKAKELDLKIHAVGNVDDHVHIVVSIPPKSRSRIASVISKVRVRTLSITWMEAMVNLNGRKVMARYRLASVLWKRLWLMPQIKNSIIKIAR